VIALGHRHVNESEVNDQPSEEMSHSAAASQPQEPPVDPSPRKYAAQDLAKIMRTGAVPTIARLIASYPGR
jgi:hypothetical protein